MEEAEIIRKLSENTKEFQKLRKELFDCRDEYQESYHNIDKRFWRVVWEKYENARIIVVNGALFYKIKDIDSTTGLYSQILWDLSLSDKNYEIKIVDEIDGEGNFDFSYYEIIDLD